MPFAIACRAALPLLFVFLLTPWVAQAASETSPPGFAVQHYAVQLEPEFSTQTILGQAVVRVLVLNPALRQVELDVGALQIDAIHLGRQALHFERAGKTLQVSLPRARRRGHAMELRIDYHGKPVEGLTFWKDGLQASTAFSTSQWMPCIDAPDVRATLDLTLVLPADMQSVANGQAHFARTLRSGKVATTWSMRQPMPSYLYGFVAGQFTDISGVAAHTQLRNLAPPEFSGAQVAQIFQETPDMLAFYEARAGVRYPFARYTQVVLRGPGAQEMAGFSILGERYGQRALKNGHSIWLGAHELAHTWWGNGVTNQNWNHFWLNEGIATFMTAAYLEHRFGTDEYYVQIDAAREKYEGIQKAGHDKPLVFPDWDHPTADDRSLVYDKGAYVVHLLRQELGEDLFWKGLRIYTQKFWGRSVVSQDFQKAMEQASGRDLSAFFDKWVYR